MTHGLTVARINWEFVKRIDPAPVRTRRGKLKGRPLWALQVSIDLKRLLAARTAKGPDPIIRQYLDNPDLIWRGTSSTIGAEVELALAERIRLGIHSLRPYDVPWRVCRRLTKLARNSRKKLKAREERRAAGMIPHSESLAQTKPWEKEGIGRSTWFDRRRKMELSDNQRSDQWTISTNCESVISSPSLPGLSTTQADMLLDGTNSAASSGMGTEKKPALPSSPLPISSHPHLGDPATSTLCSAMKRRLDESVPPPNEELEQAAHSSPIEFDGGAGTRLERDVMTPVAHDHSTTTARFGHLARTPSTADRLAPSKPDQRDEGQPMAPELPKTEPKPNHFRGEIMEQLRPDDLKETIPAARKFFCAGSIPVWDRARGRWQNILPAFGIDPKFLTSRNGPCPMCGGKDRWRFTDHHGGGKWWCNACGHGDGIDLAMKFTKQSFADVVKRIEDIIGDAAPQFRRDKPRSPDRTALNALWQHGRPIEPDDPVDRYLTRRSITIRDYPRCLRFVRQAKHADGTVHPAMLAAVSDTDGKPATIHKTYLTVDGQKAAVDRVRLFCPGSRPEGGAVRLAAHGTELGIAEGIETALSAAQLHGVPVWSALDAGGLERFIPPPEVTRLLIFGDHDQNFAGHKAAYCLAMRAILVLKIKVEVKIPDRVGADWNDVLRGVQP